MASSVAPVPSHLLLPAQCASVPHPARPASLHDAEECLLNSNRNPQLSRAEIEGWLRSMLGVQVRQGLAAGAFKT